MLLYTEGPKSRVHSCIHDKSTFTICHSKHKKDDSRRDVFPLLKANLTTRKTRPTKRHSSVPNRKYVYPRVPSAGHITPTPRGSRIARRGTNGAGGGARGRIHEGEERWRVACAGPGKSLIAQCAGAGKIQNEARYRGGETRITRKIFESLNKKECMT